ncbi:5172_t:CDS:1, partial [Dentiscutata heterogama]
FSLYDIVSENLKLLKEIEKEIERIKPDYSSTEKINSAQEFF